MGLSPSQGTEEEETVLGGGRDGYGSEGVWRQVLKGLLLRYGPLLPGPSLFFVPNRLST